MKEQQRFPLLALAIVTLLSGLWAGLVRIGWQWPPLSPTLPINHGPLMVSGFLGTVIGIERAVALELVLKWRKGRKLLLYLGPLVTLVGAMLLIFGQTATSAGSAQAVSPPLLITIGSLFLLIMFGIILQMLNTMYTAVMALGALSWLIGNILWLFGKPIHIAVWWWAAFLIFTIAGERLELSRILGLTTRKKVAFATAVSLTIIGLILLNFNYSLGIRTMGVGYILLSIWLLRYDVVRRTIRLQGLPRFIAFALLAGYIWLIISGIVSVIIGGVSAGLLYDAILHTIFLGFVFSMIFGHAPIIFPAILNVQMAYKPTFYIHLALLHITLIMRIVGDLTSWVAGRQWGGLLNAIVLLIFLANTMLSLKKENN